MFSSKMWILLLSFALLFHQAPAFYFACDSTPQGCVTNSPPLVSPETLIELHGFKGETHEIITSDGYSLTAHRLYGSKHTSDSPVILLQHGFAGSSMEFLLSSKLPLPLKVLSIMGQPTEFHAGNFSGNIAFTLAEKGYDVWLLNSRGNTYSRGHKLFDHASGKNSAFRHSRLFITL